MIKGNLLRLKRSLSSTSLNWRLVLTAVTITLLTVCLTLMIATLTNNRPIADDFFYFSADFAKNPLRALLGFWRVGEGRFAQGFDQALFYGLFDWRAVQIYPFWLLFVATLSFNWLLLSLNRVTKLVLSIWQRWLFSLLLAFSLFFMSPYFIDSVAWFSSAAVHFAGLVWVIFMFAVVVDFCIFRRQIGSWQFGWRNWLKYFLLTLLAVFHLTHSEIANFSVVALVLIFGLLYAGNQFGKISKTQRRQAVWLGVGLILLASLPVLLMAVSPAVQDRIALRMRFADYFSGSPVSNSLASTIVWLVLILSQLGSAQVIGFSFLVALWLNWALGSKKLTRYQGVYLRLIILGLALAQVLFLIVNAIALGGLSYRTSIWSTFMLFVGYVAVWCFMINYCRVANLKMTQNLRLILVGAVLLAAVAAGCATVVNQLKIDRIMALRAIRYDSRDRYLKAARAKGLRSDQLSVAPAPYLTDTEAADLWFAPASNEGSFALAILRMYGWEYPAFVSNLTFPIEYANEVPRVDYHQPDWYCTDYGEIEVHLKSCDELTKRTASKFEDYNYD